MNKKSRPPGKSLNFLLRFMDFEERENFKEYMISVYRELLHSSGRRKARIWFLSQLIRSLPKLVIKFIEGDIIMFKNYLKTAIRNIRRQRLYSLINISGLAVSLICCMLILFWVHDEWSYDRFHTNADQIYRAIIIDPNVGMDKSLAVTPIPLAPTIKNEIPEITYATRISPSEIRFVFQDCRFDERGLFVSNDFFEMFSFPFIQGNPEKIKTDLNTIAISEKTAKKIFGTIDPIGQILGTERGSEFVISGVFKDIPSQSHLQPDYLMNFRYLEQLGRDLNRWRDVSFYTYLMLDKNANVQNVIQKITECHNTHLPDLKVTYQLQPLKQIYLDPPYMFDTVLHGSRSSVIVFSIIAAAILIIACINFINLSTARAVRRSMEVGLRKVVGAKRSQLIRQFFSESAMITIVASLLAFGGMVLFLPAFNTLVNKQISIAVMKNGYVFLGFLSIILLAGLGSGIYPALYLSSFHPTRVIKGAWKGSMRGSLLRKMLIVFQFTLTITVMTSVLTLGKQLHFISQMDLGYDKSHLLTVSMQRDMASQYETIKQELLQNSNILSATATANLPMHLQSGALTEEWEGKAIEAKVHLKILWVDEDYVKTFRMEMAEGNFFSKKRNSDQYGFVLNQAAVKAMELESPIGNRATINNTEGYIIGVVKDFHFRSLHHPIEPMVFINEPSLFYNMVIRLAPNALKTQETIQSIETLWKNFAPDNPFIYSFLDERLNSLYHGEQLMGTIFRCFAGLTIFIACLGLLGMASFTAEQRTKEIGIRKVLGASVPGMAGLLMREFTKWVVLANLLAWPIAYYFMNKWLQNFAYRTGLSVWIFLISGLAAFGIALLTVSYKSIKAATINPVNSLRYE